MKKILIIDDNKDIRIFYWLYFKAKGWEVEEADDWIEGIKKIHQNTFDIVLLDMMMPNLDGFSVLEAIKQISKNPVKIVAFSNMWESIDEKVKGQWADLSLIKSNYSPIELYTKIIETFFKE